MKIIDDILRDVFGEDHTVVVSREYLREVLIRRLVPLDVLKDAAPVILYFPTDEDRVEFINKVRNITDMQMVVL